MVRKKTQTHKTTMQQPLAHVPHVMRDDYHSTIVARMAALLCVPASQWAQMLYRARRAVSAPSAEHPDARVLRAAWTFALAHADGDCADAKTPFHAITDPALRVMVVLRVVDRMPYETIAAVWHAYTPERIAQEVGALCHKLYRLSDPKEHIAQSDFVEVMRLADAQISMAQLAQLRQDLSAHADVVWAFYDTLRAQGQTIGVAVLQTVVESDMSDVVMTSVDASSPIAQLAAKPPAEETVSSAPPSDAITTNEPKSAMPQKQRRKRLRRLSRPLRTVVFFLAMVAGALVLVFLALFVLAQFDAGTPANAPQATGAQPPAKAAVATEVPQERSVQELVASLRKHALLARDDTAAAVMARDTVMAALPDQIAQVRAVMQ